MNKKMIAYFAGRLEWALSQAAANPDCSDIWNEYAVSVTAQAWEFVS